MIYFLCFLSGVAGMGFMFATICLIPELTDIINSISKLFKKK